ncbi:hypothetical protein DL98DRAFT_595008 [Cadophora sp. DSE1049]|nr:hypothetical protein DL98DRAFT_595008 [Cadophora sp. DSE1049]
MSSCDPSSQRAPLRANFWTPQPDHFADKEQALLKDFKSTYIIERFGDLRYAIRSLADDAPWNATTVRPSFDFRAHVQQTLDTQQYPYKEIELTRLTLLHTRLPNAASRGSALYALLSWIMIANISLHGSPQYTLLPPGLLSITTQLSSKTFDEFSYWAWEKTRVYLCHLLCPTDPLTVLRDDLKQPLPNPTGADHLLGLVCDLLAPFLTLHNDKSDAIKRCIGISTRVGLALQRDLRPWGLSFLFAHTVASPGGLREPAKVLPFNGKPLWKFDAEDQQDFVTEKEVTLFPALVALGDDSGRRHEVPIVIVAAEVEGWKKLMKPR